MARVFTGNEVDLAQYAQRALSDVFEVANRRRDDEKGAGHGDILALRAASEN